MKKPDLTNRYMGKLTIIIPAILISVTLLVSCNRSNNNKLIPSKDLVDVLSELYIADGLLLIPAVHSRFSLKDSTTNYMDIIKKHGFTPERMDKTMRYYFDENPEKLENIYDQVLNKLSQTQVLLEKESAAAIHKAENLWKGPDVVEVPGSGEKNSVWFNIQAKDTGNYVLEFTSTIYRNDRSLNPKVTVFFWHTDSSITGNRIAWSEIILPKDGKSHNYSLSKRNQDTTFTHFGGWLLNSDPKEGKWKKHAKIENITIRKSPLK
jgi:hypothetical protein